MFSVNRDVRIGKKSEGINGRHFVFTGRYRDIEINPEIINPDDDVSGYSMGVNVTPRITLFRHTLLACTDINVSRKMLSTRQIFRVLSSRFNGSSLQKFAAPISHEIARDSSFLRRNNSLDQRINIHTSPCTVSAVNQPVIKARQPLGKLSKKLRLSFTCKRCDTRNTKTMSKLCYETGVVIIRCDGCKNNHLIADNLGWFSNQKAKMNIETILAKKGEKVRKVQDYAAGCIEILSNEESIEVLEQNGPIEVLRQNGPSEVLEQNSPTEVLGQNDLEDRSKSLTEAASDEDSKSKS